jgi:hypothetical protein
MAGLTQETGYFNDVPIVNVMAGTDFKLSLGLGRFNPFGKVGYYMIPTKSNYHSMWYWDSEDRWVEYSANSPKSTMLYGVGADIRLTNKIDFTFGADYFLSDSYDKIRLSAGLLHLLRQTNSGALKGYLGGFYDEGGVTGFSYFHYAIKVGLEYEKELVRNLFLNARVYYYHNVINAAVRDYREHSGELSATVGFHYRIPIRASRFDMPKSSTRRKAQPKHRQINVPCSVHKPNYKPSSNIFNRP